MPITRTENIIGFSDSSTQGRIDFVFELAERQRELARFTLENTDMTESVRTYLQCVLAISSSNYGALLFRGVELIEKMEVILERISFVVENVDRIKKYLDFGRAVHNTGACAVEDCAVYDFLKTLKEECFDKELSSNALKTSVKKICVEHGAVFLFFFRLFNKCDGDAKKFVEST